MSSRFCSPAPGQLDQQQRDLYETIAGGPRSQGTQAFPLADDEGRLHGPFGIMLLNPAIGSLLQDLGSGLRFRGSLTPREREIAILTVGAFTRSEFEVWAHRRVATIVGLLPEEIDAVLIGRFRSQDAREQLCHDFIRSALTGDDVSDTEFFRARELLGESTLLELTVAAGYYFTLATMLRVFQVGSPSDS